MAQRVFRLRAYLNIALDSPPPPPSPLHKAGMRHFCISPPALSGWQYGAVGPHTAHTGCAYPYQHPHPSVRVRVVILAHATHASHTCHTCCAPRAGLCLRWRLQRPCRPWCQVRQGGCDRDPRRHHPGQDVAGACAPRLLGQQDWQGPHRADEGARQVRLCLGASGARTAWCRHCRRRHAQEGAPDGGHRGLLHKRARLDQDARQLRQGHVQCAVIDVWFPVARPVEGDQVHAVADAGVHRLPGQAGVWRAQGGRLRGRLLKRMCAATRRV
eukprot:364287-Chlamydomonas_euryale.AAC.16